MPRARGRRLRIVGSRESDEWGMSCHQEQLSKIRMVCLTWAFQMWGIQLRLEACLPLQMCTSAYHPPSSLISAICKSISSFHFPPLVPEILLKMQTLMEMATHSNSSKVNELYFLLVFSFFWVVWHLGTTDTANPLSGTARLLRFSHILRHYFLLVLLLFLLKYWFLGLISEDAD